MNKDAFYFPHDTNAQDDEKIWKLLMDMKWEGYGLYWAVIERLHGSADGWMRTDCDRIAFALRTQSDRINTLLHDFDLFIFDGDRFTSKRVLENVEARKDKTRKARESALKKWSDATALRTQSDRIAKKERKGKEIKKPPNPLLIPDDLKRSEREIRDWLEYKRQKGHSYKPKGLEALWRAFRGIPEQKRRETVDRSMANNWSGLYEDKSKPAVQPRRDDIPNAHDVLRQREEANAK